MIIKVLTEDTARCNAIENEFGLSLYIETGKHKLLFDTGMTDLFVRNAKRLNVNIAEIDTCIVSHGHSDHGGGIHAFLETNNHADVYVNENAFYEHYSVSGGAIGIDEALSCNRRINRTTDKTILDDDLLLFTGNHMIQRFPTQSIGMTVRIGDKLVADTFMHEQYLVVTEGDKRVLFSGCSHKGIMNILDFAANMHITHVIGGFHLKSLQTEQDAELYAIANSLNSMPIEFYTCHCTGLAQFAALKTIMGDKLTYIASGDVITLE